MDNSAPLTGIRVIDLGRHQAGPRCGLMLARMGADVIKVESLEGEDTRSGAGLVRGQSPYWVQMNSGKRSLALDLWAEDGKQIVRDLVKVSDILIENFRPGTMDQMGFADDRLWELNSRIVIIHVSAYGQYGPYRDRVGYDPVGQAISGHMWQNGYRDSPDSPPLRTSFSLVDRMTALHATIGALGALWERERSGKGQAIDVCLADTGYTMTEIPITGYLGSGNLPRRDGNGRGLRNAYETADGWILLAAGTGTEAMWKRTCEALGKLDWLEDPRFAVKRERDKNASEMEKELVPWFKSRKTNDIVEYLSGFGLPCAPINDIPQAAADPHLLEREMLVEVPDPIAGKIHVAGKIIKFSRTPMVVGSAAVLGQHTEEILKEIGYSSEQTQDLLDRKVIGSA